MDLRDFLDRYGVTLAVVSAVTLVVMVLPGNAPDRVERFGGIDDGSSDAATGPFAESGADGEGPTGGLGPEGPGGSSGGVGAPTAGSVGGADPGSDGPTTQNDSGIGEVVFGQGTCRPDGRQAGISRYMPPCASFSGFNGGATARGVTEDAIKIVRYRGPLDPGTQAILESGNLADDPETQKRSYEALLTYYNQHHQTYGREVVMVDYEGGDLEDDEAMRADAVKIANDIRAFAVIVGTPEAPIPQVLARELAQRGVICICTTSLTSTWYQENPPYVFSSLPTITEYSRHIAEYIGKRLAGKKARWAGDELNPAQGYTQMERRFGLVYLEGTRGRANPDARRAKDELLAELAKYGVRLHKVIGYMYDPGRNQQDVTNVIAQLKAANITTVIPYVDPLYPILFTQEATRQTYFPEWFISGTGLSDTTTAGRLYDQQQWRHAFGVSPLWVTWVDERNSAGWREYHHGRPQDADGDEGVLINIYRAYFQTLFHGIQLAGPRLTPDAFARGEFSYPKTGGTAALPLVFRNRQLPTEIKDFTEVWYDVDRQGKDERGEDGRGMVMKANMGERYLLGEWPSSNAAAFRDEGAIAVSDNPPGGGDPPHEQDGHTHSKRCMTCTD